MELLFTPPFSCGVTMKMSPALTGGLSLPNGKAIQQAADAARLNTA